MCSVAVSGNTKSDFQKKKKIVGLIADFEIVFNINKRFLNNDADLEDNTIFKSICFAYN